MSEMWTRLGQPDVETMLAEIAANDMEAAALARAVWESLPPPERDQWREQIASSVLSYRSIRGKSRMTQIAIERLTRLNDS